MVQRELEANGFDQTKINGGGLKITTTFDKKAQNAAVDSAQKYTKQSADAAGKKAANLHAAIASVEVGTGEVLALYGGPDYVENSRNWATTPRPSASTFKAYALAAGLEDGYSLLSRFNGNTFTPPGDTSPVRNEFSNQYGRVNLIRATAESINTAFVDLVTSMKDGADKVIKMAEATGAPKGAGWDADARNLPLGTPEVSPLAQAGAFATFGNDGKHVPNHVVKEVRDANNRVLYKANPQEKRAMSSDIAADVTFALSSVIEEGTGRSVQTLNRPVAGKTGTKDRGDDITSAWFVAYTKQISTAVMYVAGESGSDDLDDYRRPGDSTFFGGTYPAMTWEEYMQVATEDQPVKEFDEPAYVNQDKAEAAEPTPTATRSSEPTESPTDEPSETSEPSETETESEEPSRDPTTTKPTATATRPTATATKPTPTATSTTRRPANDTTPNQAGQDPPGGGPR
jgi:membrane peptidoglycan carboxypeptidase